VLELLKVAVPASLEIPEQSFRRISTENEEEEVPSSSKPCLVWYLKMSSPAKKTGKKSQKYASLAFNCPLTESQFHVLAPCIS
jgi:hypothetical protein